MRTLLPVPRPILTTHNPPSLLVTCFQHRLFIIIFLAIVTPLFFIPLDAIPPYATVRDVFNFGHIIAFFVVFSAWQYIKPCNMWWHVLVALIGVLVVSVAIEFAQSISGRNASVDDILKNMVGTCCGIFFSGAWSGRARLVKGALILGVLLSCAEVVRGLYIDALMFQQFPVINQFNSFAEKDRVRTDQRARILFTKVENTSAMAVELQGGSYTGIAIPGFYGDWNGYNEFVFDIFNPSEAILSIALKITDAQHDKGPQGYSHRFNRRLVVNPGWNSYVIPVQQIRQGPEDRPLDLSSIRYVEWFGSNNPHFLFYLRNAQLR
jgi:hypothetical protein